MKSDIICVDNHGNGFQKALAETQRVAAYLGLKGQETIRLQLCTEEMLSMARSVTGEMQASFWLECEDNCCALHLSTKTVMDKEKRAMLLSAATSRKNEAANTFLGKLRDAFEAAMASEVDHSDQIPDDIWGDLPNRVIEDTEWDGYERSILRKVADEIKIGIRGGVVDMTVIKKIA